MNIHIIKTVSFTWLKKPHYTVYFKTMHKDYACTMIQYVSTCDYVILF